MGKMFESVQEMVHDNHSEFEKLVHSQYAKYTEGVPFFTDYYSLSKNASTVDTGIMSVDKLTGKNSPIRFHKIKDFPLMGMEQVQLDLEDNDDIGFQMNYEGEAIVLPNTIYPQVDDRFTMTAVGKHFIFRVTEFHNDTILPKNYYKINFITEAADDISITQNIESQVIRTFRAVYDNYGTQDKFIIEEGDYKDAESIQALIDELSKLYLRYFYNERYNALVVQHPHDITLVYDAFVNHFCNEEQIFAQNPKNYWNYKFYEEKRPEFQFLYYGHSFQSAIKDQDIHLLESDRFMRYIELIPTFTDSIFQFWGDFSTKGASISNRKNNPFGFPNFEGVPEYLIKDIISDSVETVNFFHNVIVKWMNKDAAYLNKLILEFDGKLRVRPSYFHYMLIPCVLFILQCHKSAVTKGEISNIDMIPGAKTPDPNGILKNGIPAYVYRAKGDILRENQASAERVTN